MKKRGIPMGCPAFCVEGACACGIGLPANHDCVKENTKRWTFMGMSIFLVRLKGFEPPTFWFVAKHSIQLSYSRIRYFVVSCSLSLTATLV